jgi:hypothetical protein
MSAERKMFRMSDSDYRALLDVCKAAYSGPYIVAGGMPPPDPSEAINNAWRELGNRMGFDAMSVESTGINPHDFTAIPKDAQP